MAQNDSTHESEHEPDVRQALDGEWHEQQNVQVAILDDDEEGSRSSGRLRVFEPESDDESTVALSVESETEDRVVRLDVSPALLLSDKLGQVAEKVSCRGGR
jgi:hypothetical protein